MASHTDGARFARPTTGTGLPPGTGLAGFTFSGKGCPPEGFALCSFANNAATSSWTSSVCEMTRTSTLPMVYCAMEPGPAVVVPALLGWMVDLIFSTIAVQSPQSFPLSSRHGSARSVTG